MLVMITLNTTLLGLLKYLLNCVRLNLRMCVKLTHLVHCTDPTVYPMLNKFCVSHLVLVKVPRFPR